MTKLFYKVNGIENSVEVPDGATDARIVKLPEIGDLVRITQMGTGANDQPQYIGKVGPIVARYGMRSCRASEILVGGCTCYVTGWEIIARRNEILSS